MSNYVDEAGNSSLTWRGRFYRIEQVTDVLEGLDIVPPKY